MFELVATSIGIGITDFISSLIVTKSACKNYSFNIGDFNAGIRYNANLDLDRKNFHMTIELDLNY